VLAWWECGKGRRSFQSGLVDHATDSEGVNSGAEYKRWGGGKM